MTTHTDNGERTPTRWGDIAGIAFVVLFFVSFVFLDTPDADAPVAEWEAFFDDSGNRTQTVLAMVLMVLSGFAFLWFAVSMRVRLRAAATAEQLRAVAAGAALLFVAMLVAGGVAWGNTAGAVEFGGTTVPDGDISRMFEQLGFALILLAGGFASAVFVGVTSLLGRKTGVFPPWLVNVGYVVAVLLVFSVMFFPILALLIWVLIVSIRSLVSRASSEAVPS
jgi:hypothetical protein